MVDSLRFATLNSGTSWLGSSLKYVSNVGIDPPFQPLTGKHLALGSANREDGARLDIAADNFWGRDQNRAFFDIRVSVPSLRVTKILPSVSTTRKMSRRGKEHTTVLSSSGGMDQQPTWSTKE